MDGKILVSAAKNSEQSNRFLNAKGQPMGLWDGVKRASKAVDADTPPRYFAAGKKIICDQCGHDDFDEGQAQLNTPGMTFLGLDWANRTATTLMCKACGRIHWFSIRPEQK